MDESAAAKVIHSVFVTEVETTDNNIVFRWGWEGRKEPRIHDEINTLATHKCALGFKNCSQKRSNLHVEVRETYERTAFDEL